ncbi:MAG: hypothetical protein IPP91_00530 [Betaproteobacteria bacterium]|nr:hypothetical protein [Betaproteobacteria bacterium]
MSMTRVAFAGLSPLREGIVRDALGRAGKFQVVEPWTSLSALHQGGQRGAQGEEGTDILFVELEEAHLPGALRAMLAGTSRLRIIGLSVDAAWATVFELREHQTVLLQCVADDLCAAIDAAAGTGEARLV